MLCLLLAGRQNNLMSRNNVDRKDKKINGLVSWVHFSSLVASLSRCDTLNKPRRYCLRYMNNSTFIYQEAAWPSGQRVGLAIRRSRVRVPLWPLAGFVLGRPEFISSATLVNSQLAASCQLGYLSIY